MALEFQLDGRFDLDGAFEQLLRDALPQSTTADPGPGNTLCLCDELVEVTAGYRDSHGSIPEEMGVRDTNAQLWFRVLDKSRSSEASDEVIRCVDSVLKATHGDLLLRFNGDLPYLVRRAGRLRLLTMGYAPKEEFWHITRRSRLITSKFEWDTWKRGRRV